MFLLTCSSMHSKQDSFYTLSVFACFDSVPRSKSKCVCKIKFFHRMRVSVLLTVVINASSSLWTVGQYMVPG